MTAVRALLCSAVLLSCGLTVSAVAGDEKPAPQPSTAAAVELQPGTWKDITALVAKHQGKIVVVDVWSTSCAPCMQEFPGLVRLHKSYPEQVV